MITRRELLVTGTAAVVACRRVEPAPTRRGMFSADEVAFILWLADVMIPSQDGFGGGAADPVAVLLAPTREAQAKSVKREISRLQGALGAPPLEVAPDKRLRVVFGAWPVEETEQSLRKALFAELLVNVRTATFHAFYTHQQGWQRTGFPGPPLGHLAGYIKGGTP